MNVFKYSVKSFWYAKAVSAWIDYNDAIYSTDQIYDYLNYLFDMMIKEGDL